MPNSCNFVDLHVGAKVRSRRIQLGLSQDVLARRIGVNPGALQRYESGADRIGAKSLFAISKAFKVGPAYFFEDMDISIGVSRDLRRLN